MRIRPGLDLVHAGNGIRMLPQVEVILPRAGWRQSPRQDFQLEFKGVRVLVPSMQTQSGGIRSGFGIVRGGDRFLVSWTSPEDDDYEIFTQVLDATGKPIGGSYRVTYTDADVLSSNIAWNGSTFAIVWESRKANGVASCAVHDACDSDQVFATLIGENGAPFSEPVQFSNNINDSVNAVISWDGIGWTAVWQLWGQNRWRMVYGQMICEY